MKETEGQGMANNASRPKTWERLCTRPSDNFVTFAFVSLGTFLLVYVPVQPSSAVLSNQIIALVFRKTIKEARLESKMLISLYGTGMENGGNQFMLTAWIKQISLSRRQPPLDEGIQIH